MDSIKEYTFIATGDVGVHRRDPNSMFAGVRDALAQGDLVFGQLETPVSDRGSPLPQAGLPCRCMPESAAAIRRAGYDVMSFAGNHCMDYGIEAFEDTLGHMKAAGVELVGVGMNIGEARRPCIRTLPDGTKIGFLAYSSICPQGYWADDMHCGFAPMRGLTAAVPDEPDQPETAVSLYSFPHPRDLEKMLGDIRRLRPMVDILAVSIHWGVHFTPGAIGWYQKYTARFAIEAGADIILGHHAHIMKPIEVYRGRPIIYCMSNFAIEGPQVFSPVPLHKTEHHKAIAARNPETAADPTKQMPTDSYKTYYLKCRIAGGRIKTVSVCPCQLDPADCRPRALHASDPEFGEIAAYLEKITRSEGFATVYEPCGDELRVSLDRGSAEI